MMCCIAARIERTLREGFAADASVDPALSNAAGVRAGDYDELLAARQDQSRISGTSSP